MVPFVLGLVLLASCVGVHLKYTGLVQYEVSSPDFRVADKIEYKNQDGKTVTLTNVEMPWALKIEFDQKETYHTDPTWFRVTIGSNKNKSGGRVTTICLANPEYLNHKDTMVYQANVEIVQVGWAHTYPDTF